LLRKLTSSLSTSGTLIRGKACQKSDGRLDEKLYLYYSKAKINRYRVSNNTWDSFKKTA
jgi:hypothetical protein